MTIEFDCSDPGLVVIIQGVTCNCGSQQQKQQICDVLRDMNSHELLCKERRKNNPNLPPYDWTIDPLMGGIAILKGGVVAATIFTEENLSLINSIFQRQINEGIGWCMAPQVS